MHVSSFMIAKGVARFLSLILATVAYIVHLETLLVRRSRSGIVAVADHRTNDHASRPLPFFASWGLPILILIGSNFLVDMVPLVAIVAILSAALFWMGAACVLNARRCRRRHCFYSGPIFMLGALAVLLVGLEIISLGEDGLVIVIGVTLSLALSTYLTEPVFGRYID